MSVDWSTILMSAWPSARRQEVNDTFGRWAAECAAVDDAVGFTAAIRANEKACAALNDAEDDVDRSPACTIAALVAKARWTVSVADAEGSDGPFERFVRQVAALGEVVS